MCQISQRTTKAASRWAVVCVCVCVSTTLCGNHRVNLVEAACFAFVNKGLHGDLFCASLFLQSSGMFLRLCVAAKVLSANAVVRRDRPAGNSLRLELAQFLFDAKSSVLDHQRLMPSGRARKDTVVTVRAPMIDLREWHDKVSAGQAIEAVVAEDSCAEPSMKKHARCLLDFVLLFNGCWRQPVWQHHCLHPTCCRGEDGAFDEGVMRKKMVAAVLCLLFATMPTTPEKGKWTKTWPCLVWFAQGLGVHDTIRQALALACEEGHASRPAGTANQPGGDDGSGFDVDLQAIRGVRRRRSESFAANAESKYNLFLMCVLMEPLRFLCAWFLRASSASHSGVDQWPPASDLASVGEGGTSALASVRGPHAHMQPNIRPHTCVCV